VYMLFVISRLGSFLSWEVLPQCGVWVRWATQPLVQRRQEWSDGFKRWLVNQPECCGLQQSALWADQQSGPLVASGIWSQLMRWSSEIEVSIIVEVEKYPVEGEE